VKAKNKKILTEFAVRKTQATTHAVRLWDAKCPGLVLRVQPATGHRAFFFSYSFAGQARWLHLGTLYLKDARDLVMKFRVKIAEGVDPYTERETTRQTSFADLHQRYVTEHAMTKNKSWRQADRLVRRYLLPKWGKIAAKAISRSDVRAMMSKTKAPVLANQVLAAASAVFTWAVNQEIVVSNPCKGVASNPTTSRERILSDAEIAMVWQECNTLAAKGAALKTLLLTGQRPGEVARMRWEHIDDGWWTLPGQPVPEQVASPVAERGGT
jgi:hypothetical protein